MAKWTGTCTLNAPGHCKDRRTAEITVEDAQDDDDAREKMKLAASRKITHNSNHAHEIDIAGFERHD